MNNEKQTTGSAADPNDPWVEYPIKQMSEDALSHHFRVLRDFFFEVLKPDAAALARSNASPQTRANLLGEFVAVIMRLREIEIEVRHRAGLPLWAGTERT